MAHIVTKRWFYHDIVWTLDNARCGVTVSLELVENRSDVDFASLEDLADGKSPTQPGVASGRGWRVTVMEPKTGEPDDVVLNALVAAAKDPDIHRVGPFAVTSPLSAADTIPVCSVRRESIQGSKNQPYQVQFMLTESTGAVDIHPVAPPEG